MGPQMHRGWSPSDISHQLGRLQSDWDRNVSDARQPNFLRLTTCSVNPSTPPQSIQPRQTVETSTVPTTLHPTALQQVIPQPQTIQPSESLVHPVPAFPYHMYPPTMEPPRSIHVATPPQWPNGIPPHHAHIPQIIPRPDHYREDQWNAVYTQPPPHAIQSAEYDYSRYRDAHAAWVAGPNDYYTPGVRPLHHHPSRH